MMVVDHSTLKREKPVAEVATCCGHALPIAVVVIRKRDFVRPGTGELFPNCYVLSYRWANSLFG